MERLEKLLRRIKSKYGVTLNEENYQAKIIESLNASPDLIAYFRRYMEGNEVDLEWGCLIFLLIKAADGGDARALKRYYRALRKYPPHFFVEAIMAEWELNYWGNLFEAKGKLCKALELKPNDPAGNHNLGLIYYFLGTFKKAAECYEKAITYSRDALEPADLKAISLYRLAVIKVNLDRDYLTAVRLLQEAVKVKPDYEPAGKALAKLKGQR